MFTISFHLHGNPGGTHKAHLHFTDDESEGQGGDGPTGEQKQDGPGLQTAKASPKADEPFFPAQPLLEAFWHPLLRPHSSHKLVAEPVFVKSHTAARTGRNKGLGVISPLDLMDSYLLLISFY